MTLFVIADRLNKFVSEVEELEVNEVREWIAFLNIEAKQSKKKR